MIPRFALVLTLGVLCAVLVIAAGAAGRLDWLPPQKYFPDSYLSTKVTCVAERYPESVTSGPLIDDVEAAWYPQHWRAAREPSLYRASQAPGASRELTYRFTWLRSFHAPVIVRVDQTPRGGLRLHAVQLFGQGGYSPGGIDKRLDRDLTAEEATKLRRLIASTRLLDQPQAGCMEGTDGSNWLFEANDHGQYRYLMRWMPERGPVHDAGLMLLGFTGWTFKDVY